MLISISSEITSDRDCSSRLAGKVAIVTGAGRGIGRAIVERLAEEGASVVASQRSADEGEELAAGLVERGRSAVFVAADVRVEDDAERLVREAVSRFGRLDVLCNNAGVGLLKAVAETTRDEYDLVLDTNLWASSRAPATRFRACSSRARGRS